MTDSMENGPNFEIDFKMDAADEMESVGGDPEEIYNHLIAWDDIPDAVLWQVLSDLDVQEARGQEAAPAHPSAEPDDEPQQAPPTTDTKSSFVKLSEEELNKKYLYVQCVIRLFLKSFHKLNLCLVITASLPLNNSLV